ncbi:hypothetical protein OU415_02320 [Saccharopolyspora sp. WRP15-2]|uniref:Uncharacterized protein n=1 Tax=Saccharopolyspora oryzae TaxID=2997343 RepID=A0ABT4URC8_9PSEU|nr:hypothetical protein [Saccharopolyspora oryzae]MDA3624252.1 hypothetical protein [Saccharopolyspora oryzae]
MLIVYKGRYDAVEVPDVGGVVLEHGVPKEIADTPKSRQLLEQPDFEEVKESKAKPERVAKKEDDR